jgi:transketolase
MVLLDARFLEDKARMLRYDIVKMIGCNRTGHVGGACSIADIIAVLYWHKMKHDPQNPHMDDRDRLILSKGHAAIVQYAALAESGYFPVEELWELKNLGAKLQGHPDMRKTTGIEANTGSLGQGLSIACGMAAGAKLDQKKYTIYCVMGDAEIAEGQIWEAAMAASFYKLDNVVAILDRNGISATGFLAERFRMDPIEEKWKAFGWNTSTIDGHNIPQIINALNKADKKNGKPTLIIANTVKGKGIPFAENNPAFHNGSMNQEQYDMVCANLYKK